MTSRLHDGFAWVRWVASSKQQAATLKKGRQTIESRKDNNHNNKSDNSDVWLLHLSFCRLQIFVNLRHQHHHHPNNTTSRHPLAECRTCQARIELTSQIYMHIYPLGSSLSHLSWLSCVTRAGNLV